MTISKPLCTAATTPPTTGEPSVLSLVIETKPDAMHNLVQKLKDLLSESHGKGSLYQVHEQVAGNEKWTELWSSDETNF